MRGEILHWMAFVAVSPALVRHGWQWFGGSPVSRIRANRLGSSGSSRWRKKKGSEGEAQWEGDGQRMKMGRFVELKKVGLWGIEFSCRAPSVRCVVFRPGTQFQILGNQMDGPVVKGGGKKEDTNKEEEPPRYSSNSSSSNNFWRRCQERLQVRKKFKRDSRIQGIQPGPSPVLTSGVRESKRLWLSRTAEISGCPTLTLLLAT
jgi:hypothetical protein